MCLSTFGVEVALIFWASFCSRVAKVPCGHLGSPSACSSRGIREGLYHQARTTLVSAYCDSPQNLYGGFPKLGVLFGGSL